MNIVQHIAKKIRQGRRLSREDGLELLKCSDILGMGQLALGEKRKRAGGRVFFNVNCHINLTNVCIARCAFCAFSCDRNDSRAYLLPAGAVVDKVAGTLAGGVTEVHMVSGLHPDQPFAYYIDIVRAVKKAFPFLHIKAFTPVEIHHFAGISGLPVRDVLAALQAAGVGSLPGGGAEVLSSRVRERLCPRKASAQDWLDIMRSAHRLGMKTNATILFGHIETPREIIDHLLHIRTLQDETGGFQTFIPLPFHPANTGLASSYAKPTAFEVLKMVCIARLMLDNIEHIKAYWVMTGLKVAQLALFFGADDIDGTVVEEKIGHAAGADTAVGMRKQELITLIRQTGMTPVERDTLYNVLQEY